MSSTPAENLSKLTHLIETVHRLRAPGGCAWDRAQTHQSLRQYLIEEAYEVLDVLDQVHTVGDLGNESIRGAFKEELGDLLMQVLLHSEMAGETGAFDIYDVAEGLDQKLVRRHPHVFGEAVANSEETAFQTWEKQKAKEKALKAGPDGKGASLLDGLPKNLPSLQKAARTIEKVTKVGFQWEDLQGPLGKIDEELEEFKVEIAALEAGKNSGNVEELRAKAQGELGDLLFTLCNLAYLTKLNPEDALRGTMQRFENRFRHVEKRLRDLGKTPEQSDLKEMDQFWDEAKVLEKKGKLG
jgi:tetrapyrrole methylase family protein/MazG family protein